jgi:hypothetical protein
MYSFRRLALLLALGLPALIAAPAQSSSSSSNPAAPAPDPNQSQAQQPATQSQGQISVQARIRARRAQRRAAAIHDAYSQRYEAFVGAGFLRFQPGPGQPPTAAFPIRTPLQRVNLYSWDTGATRYRDERFGITVEGRGSYGSPFIGPNSVTNSFITKPAISTYSAVAGPTYRFYLQPKYSISGRVMGGFAYGNFSGDLGTTTPASLGLYPDGYTFAVSGSVVGEYNVTPNMGIRVAPEYFGTGFNSSMQNSLGFTAGIVYRFGKQK